MIKGKNYRFEWFNIHCKNGFYIDTSVGLEILKIPITKNEFNNIIMNMIIYHVVNFDFVKFIDGKDERGEFSYELGKTITSVKELKKFVNQASQYLEDIKSQPIGRKSHETMILYDVSKRARNFVNQI